MAKLLISLNDPFFLQRIELGKDLCLLAGFPQLAVIHHLDIRTGIGIGRVNADALADIDGNRLGIAGQNDRTDTVFFQGPNGGNRRLLRRIQEADETQEDHVLFIFG